MTVMKRKVQVIITLIVFPVGMKSLNQHFLSTKVPTLPEINAFFGEAQKTADVRKDDEKGRHTTTVRQLFFLPKGAILIDNSGIREIQLGDSSECLEKAFSEIVNAAQSCRFKDCTRHKEPGCAVMKAVKDGLTTEERLSSYHRLTEELIFHSKKSEIGLKRLEKEKYRKMAVDIKTYKKFKGKP